MMQSKALTVDQYILEAPEDKKEALRKLRSIFLEELKDYEEKMAYGGPCYERAGVIEAGFGNQKNFIGVYILKQDAFNKYISEIKNVSHGKGVLRFSKPAKIDYEVIRKMLKATAESSGAVC